MSESTQSTTGRSPFTRPGFIISAALVIAMIAAVVVIFFLPKGDGTAQPAPSSSSDNVSAAPTKSGDATGKSICGLPSTSETALGSTPKSTWTLIGKMAAPTDPKTFGPGVTDEDGFRSCFAHSPTGALYAAANLVALGSSGDPKLNQKMTDRLLMPGPGRDIAMADSRTMPSSGSSNTSVQFRGFVIKSYSRSAANVDIAFQTSAGVLGHAVLPMEWADGDWKLAIADSGRLINDITALSDLSGFIPWSGA
ncbi:hypothetical protein [Pseudarthrobacter albicanus]|uniref:hypothetical protein n=1 Tax=Pseudarthrobacter albicanus TaxID=2823873 RepID=UPI001BADE85D|nr:hypothetical protein [Pseudarthrobacter albicanus]